MRFCYLHLPRFPVQRRVLEQPVLAGKPLILTEEVKGVRRVAFASGAALRLGIRPGLTATAASAIEGGLELLLLQPALDRAALASLGEALMSIAPAFELDPPNGIWLDASAAALCGGEEGFAARALELCAAQGFLGTAAVASERYTSAAVASHARGRAPQVIWAGESARALAALPLSALPGIPPDFAALGLTRLGEVAALPPGAVVARLGSAGLFAHRFSRGGDDTPLTPEPLPEVLEEQVNLDWPAESLEPLLFGLKAIFDRLGARLSGRKRAAVKIALTFRLDPRGESQVNLTLARPTAQAKLLLELARHQLEQLRLEGAVTSFSARVMESSEDRGQQLNLGDEPAGDAPLEVVLSRLTTTLGEGALFAAEALGRHRPEAAYVPRPFRPPPRDGSFLAGTGVAVLEAREPSAVGSEWVERPSRVFTQAAPLEAEVSPEGELLAARLLGKRRKATAVAGPERLCGDWWSADPYQRDYFRVHFEGLGPVWLYRDARDGRFFLQGMFD
jgi:protein ImuB